MAVKTRSLSKALYWICTVLMIAAPLSLAVSMLWFWLTGQDLLGLYAQFDIIDPPALWTISLVTLIGLFFCALYASLLSQARQLFQLYTEGRALTFKSANALRRIGQYLLSIALLRLVTHPVLTLLLTSGNPEGQRQISIAITSTDIGFLIAAGLLTLVGSAMTEAAENAEDIKGFV